MTGRRVEQQARPAQERIPPFESYEAEAEFWDTHDFTDFEDGFQPVRVRVAKSLSEAITIRLDTATLRQLQTLASEQHVHPAQLARRWLLEHLRSAPAS